MNKILGLWHSLYGADGSEKMYRLAARERLIDQMGCERQFLDILARLEQQAKCELPVQALIEKARNGTISEEEKRQLNDLLIRDS